MIVPSHALLLLNITSGKAALSQHDQHTVEFAHVIYSHILYVSIQYVAISQMAPMRAKHTYIQMSILSKSNSVLILLLFSPFRLWLKPESADACIYACHS